MTTPVMSTNAADEADLLARQLGLRVSAGIDFGRIVYWAVDNAADAAVQAKLADPDQFAMLLEMGLSRRDKRRLPRVRHRFRRFEGLSPQW